MKAKEKVCEAMRVHKMCSVCEIAKATGLDTEVVKPLMVELSSELTSYAVSRAGSYTPYDISIIAKLYAEGKKYKEIAAAIGRSMSAVSRKVNQMQKDGILARRKQKAG